MGIKSYAAGLFAILASAGQALADEPISPETAARLKAVKIIVPSARGQPSWGTAEITRRVQRVLGEAMVVVPERELEAAFFKLKIPLKLWALPESRARGGAAAGAQYVLDVEITRQGWLFTAHAILINTATGEVQMDFRAQYYNAKTEAEDRAARIAAKTQWKLGILLAAREATATAATATSSVAAAAPPEDGAGGEAPAPEVAPETPPSEGGGEVAGSLEASEEEPAPSFLKLDIKGSARSFSLFDKLPEGSDPDQRGSVVNRLRVSANLGFGSVAKIEGAYDLIAIVGATGGDMGLTLARVSPLRLGDIPDTIHDAPNFSLQENLDRVQLSLFLGFADVIVGRQGISHGTARIFDVTDIFSPFSPLSLDREYKRGVDAVRVTVPLGELTQVEAYVVGNKEGFEKSMFLVRFQTQVFDMLDVSAYAGASYEEPTFALDLSTEIAGAGVYAEGLGRIGNGRDSSIRGTVGATYRFEFGLSTFLEAHASSLGAADAADYLVNSTGKEYANAESFLLGRFYTALSLSYELTPLLVPQFVWIQSLTDASATFIPSLAWELGEDVSATLGAIIGVGKGFVPPQDPMAPPVLRSEFGSIPITAYTEVRVYF